MENPQRPQTIAEKMLSENCVRIVGDEFVTSQQRSTSEAMERAGSRVAEMLF